METFWTVGVVAALAGNLIVFGLLLGLARELGLVLIRLGPDKATSSLTCGSKLVRARTCCHEGFTIPGCG